MPAPQGAPAWAGELALAYESGAHGQFILYGNVHDRVAVGGRLVNLAGYLENELLAGFKVVLSYDLGNGLTIERGGELVEKWGGANLKALPREPLPAIQYISRYLRYLGNLRALGREIAGERRGDPARRRSTSCRPTAPATSTAASRACCATGPRKRRSATCRSPAS